MRNRRQSPRKQFDVFFNKYLDGHPYLCRAVDLSPDGMMAVTHVEPTVQNDSFPVEIRFPGEPSSLWLWARTVRREGERQAMEFLGLGRGERRKLERCLAASAV